MMFVLTATSAVVLTLNMLAVADSIGNMEHLGFLDTSVEVHPLLRVEVLIAKVIKLLCTQ